MFWLQFMEDFVPFYAVYCMHFFAFMVAFCLFLEAFMPQFPYKSKVIKIFIAILAGLVAFFLLFNGIYAESGIENDGGYKIILYGKFFIANGLILALIFAFLSVKIKESYELFSAYLMRFLFVLSLYLLCLILLGILLLGAEFLLSIEIFEIFKYLAVIFGFFVGVAFLGMQEHISYSKALKILLLIFDIFAFSYIILLVAYFIAPIRSFESIVHIVMWFGFFILNLAFVNRGIRGQNKIFSFYVIVALALSIIALWAISLRISEYSFTPSRTFVLSLSVYIFCASLLYFIKRGLFFSFILASALVLLSSSISLPLSLNAQNRIYKELTFNLENEENFIKAYGEINEDNFNQVLKRCRDVVDFLNSYREKKDYEYCKVGIDKNKIKNPKANHYKSYHLSKNKEVIKFDEYEMIDLGVRDLKTYRDYTFKLQGKSVLIGFQNRLIMEIPASDLLKGEIKTYKTKGFLIHIKPNFISLNEDVSGNIKEITDLDAYVFIKHTKTTQKE